MLENEYKFYEKHKKEYLSKYLGKYIVIKSGNILGVYNSQDEAIVETIKKHELGTFLVQFVSKEEPPVIFRSRVVYG